MYFTNPILPYGADPYLIRHKDHYLYTHTHQFHKEIAIRKVQCPTQLSTAAERMIYIAPPDRDYCSHAVWAPELHYLRGKWYCYFAAAGLKSSHRTFILECDGDPMTDTWHFRGQLITPGDFWSIDGTVLEYEDRLYFIWSGWEGHTNQKQSIYIAAMSDPLTVTGDRTLISTPQLPWELHHANNPAGHQGILVNEGPSVLRSSDGFIYIIYSASGCWTDDYCIGVLTLWGDPMLASNWQKQSKPILQSANGVYATGHNTFFKSPSGDDWIIYHATSSSNEGCGSGRCPRMQPVSWKDGLPVIGEPVPEGIRIRVPE